MCLECDFLERLDRIPTSQNTVFVHPLIILFSIFIIVVYTQTSSLVLFLDTHHQQCPINLFRKRILGYITTTRFISKRSCPDQSEVTFGATVPVVVWSFDLSTFVSQFLLSWTVHSKQASYALLFDESGKG